MVKSYNKYEAAQTFGLVNSASSNVISLPDASARATGAGQAVVGANEEVLRWDVKKGELLSRWRDSTCNAQVTAIARSAVDPDVYAVGYEDGSIRIWDSRIDSMIITFNGHKSAVTVLVFDSTGVRLASGAKDTDIIVWDLVAEVGLFKLRGHKDQIVGLHWIVPKTEAMEGGSAHNTDSEAFILSASKDALLKVWDVTSQHCIDTHISPGTLGDCCALGVSPDMSGCITAGSGGELIVWSIDLDGLAASGKSFAESTTRRYLVNRGATHRQINEKTTGITFHPKADYFAIHGSTKAVEVFKIRSEEEVRKSLSRKRKRRREKAAATGVEDVPMGRDSDDENASPPILEFFAPFTIVRTGGKVRSVDWVDSRSHKSLQILVGCTNNLLEVYDVSTRDKAKRSKTDELPEYSRTFSVDLPGHRTDVRSVALSSDDRMLATASSGALKVWNVKTGTCLRTLECGYALCCSFLPGDKIVVVGTKSGELELFDIASSSLIEKLQAHDGAIWSLKIHPDGKSLVSGSADKSAKFWNFEIVQEEIPGTKRTSPRLRLAHSRTLKVNDDILSVCFSPDARLLAVATLDNTVKVFFNDSLKLFLNLYGHKLPVLNMSISSDSKLLATCSADKNIRLWGLDFGDCHKAFFGHSDSIMQVSFIPQPASKDDIHHFFSASKDRLIKSWDGDKFEQVQKMDGHHGEVWAMAVSKTGEFVVTASHDKSIRVWNQTDEPIFLEEEREKELEEMYEQTLTASLEADGEEGEDDEATAASKQTTATLTAGEKIMEALELGMEDLDVVRDWETRKATNPNMAPPQRDPLYMALGGISAERNVLNTLSKIPAAQLHDALLVLPFSVLPALFTFITIWVQKQWDITLVCRVLFFMLKTHQRQIVASKELKAPLENIRSDLRRTLGEVKDLLGYNLAAIKFVEQRVKERGVSTLEDAEAEEEHEAKGKRKRTFVDIA
ncbi:WD40 repeat-like protein [Trichodelitschia bisporula]|uniref:WD40 repeat-like protein n=1 Tax=Trichodelitschia bisporula TaxID=703511 RepID=A0A6G1I6R0_9PEZI|nr:WD40 repeat-like protein [Trichodelitschia bisporula]